MMKVLAGLAAASLMTVALIGGAEAQTPKFGTAAYFVEACKNSLDDKNSKELFTQGQCIGMLLAMSFFSEQLSKDYKFCSPASATGAQLATVLIRHLEQNQDKWDRPMMELADVAFRKEWPCR